MMLSGKMLDVTGVHMYVDDQRGQVQNKYKDDHQPQQDHKRHKDQQEQWQASDKQQQGASGVTYCRATSHFGKHASAV